MKSFLLDTKFPVLTLKKNSNKYLSIAEISVFSNNFSSVKDKRFLTFKVKFDFEITKKVAYKNAETFVFSQV